MFMRKQVILAVFIVSVASGTETELQIRIIFSVRPQIAHLCFVIPFGLRYSASPLETAFLNSFRRLFCWKELRFPFLVIRKNTRTFAREQRITTHPAQFPLMMLVIML